MIRAFVIWLIVMSAPVFAQPLPALFDVSGVAADDVLNVRLDPDASAEKIGALAPDAKDIEVVELSIDGKWGLISSEERSGWVSMRFLQAAPINEDYIFTKALACSGTEPFWSLGIVQGQQAVYATPDTAGETYPAGLVNSAEGRTDRFLLGMGDRLTAVIRREQCSDGMSDRVFGLDIDLVIDGSRLHSGCCSLKGD